LPKKTEAAGRDSRIEQGRENRLARIVFPGYLYFLFEHKSHPEKLVALQLLSYQQKIWGLHLKQGPPPLPVIISMVLYHGRETWTAGTDLIHLFGETEQQLSTYIPDFKYILYDLSAYHDEAIKGAVMFRVTMLLFKYVFQPDYQKRLPGILALLRSLLEQETGMQYIESVIRYVLSTVESMGATDVQAMVEQSLSPEKGELVMTLAEKLKNEGKQQGIQRRR
jgi:predicted transposase YdaD